MGTRTPDYLRLHIRKSQMLYRLNFAGRHSKTAIIWIYKYVMITNFMRPDCFPDVTKIWTCAPVVDIDLRFFIEALIYFFHKLCFINLIYIFQYLLI